MAEEEEVVHPGEVAMAEAMEAMDAMEAMEAIVLMALAAEVVYYEAVLVVKGLEKKVCQQTVARATHNC